LEKGNISDSSRKAPEEYGLFGIDYGTNYTCLAEWRGEVHPVDVVKLPKCSNKRFPSTICYIPKFNEWVIGDLAENFSEKYPDTSFINLKKKIGGTETIVKHGGDKYTPGDLMKNFLKIFRNFILELNRDIKGVVLAIPYCFYEYQRSVFMQIAREAELPVLGLINEPEAIILAYCFEARLEKYEENILVVDMGEEHLDVALFNVLQKNNYIIIKCLNINGNMSIGGKYIDRILLQKVLEKASLQDEDIWKNIFVKKHPITGKTRNTIKELKHKLSVQEKEDLINFNLIPGKDVFQEVTQKEFTGWIGEILSNFDNYLNKTIEGAGITPDKIDKVIVNGGSTKMPPIRKIIDDLVEHQLNKVVFLEDNVMIAQGAAIYAAMLRGQTEKFGLNPITPYAIGVELSNGIFDDIIIKGKRIPCTDKKVYQISNTDATELYFNIYQGNERAVEKNQLIAPFEMSDLNPLKEDNDYIIIHISIDQNGIGEIKVEVENSNISWTGPLST